MASTTTRRHVTTRPRPSCRGSAPSISSTRISAGTAAPPPRVSGWSVGSGGNDRPLPTDQPPLGTSSPYNSNPDQRGYLRRVTAVECLGSRSEALDLYTAMHVDPAADPQRRDPRDAHESEVMILASELVVVADAEADFDRHRNAYTPQ